MTKKLSLIPRWQYPPSYYQHSIESLNTGLDKVALYVPWRSLDPGRDVDIDTRFAAMPAITKKDIRENFPQSILPSDKNMEHGLASGEIELVNTSGTTNEKITNIWNQQWWDASERASWKLNSNTAVLDGNQREAILVNPRNVGFASDNADLPMENRRLSRFLYLNEKTDPESWTSSHIDRIIDELNTFKPVVLEGNPSILARFCRLAAAQSKRVYQPNIIVFTYEYPTRLHYRQIGRVFSTPTVSSYGTTETGYVFMQCEHGNFHQNVDFCRVDYQPLKPEHGGPLLGRILVSPLNNPWSYLLRFDTGDLVRLKEDNKCPCGRNSGMILSSIAGRTVNLTLTCQGRLVTLQELDEVINRLDGLDMYKLIQTEKQAYELHLVSSRTDRLKMVDEAIRLLKDLYGKESNVKIIFDNDIFHEVSGKYLVSRSIFEIDIEPYLDPKILISTKVVR
jgi:phenylacetate-coenzyme A ligase PaaK-like adenylate-forming protein